MMHGTAHLDDVLVAILRHLYANSATSFTADREEVHRAFYELKRRFPGELQDLCFRHKGFFPESLGLDQSLANLEASGLLHRLNQAPRTYYIDGDIESSYTRFVQKRLGERGLTPEQIEEIAEYLQGRLPAGAAT